MNSSRQEHSLGREPSPIEYQSNPKPVIEMEQVDKIYSSGGGFQALSKVSMQVYRGEFLGITGKSGAGKSTLLNMITGVDQISAGRIIIRANGQDTNLQELSENDRAVWRGLNMGVIYQSFQLLPTLSLMNNIMLPMDLCGLYRPRESRERAMELLRLMELEDHAWKLPSAISGGQQQRVAIARALANDPDFLVADEPTGSLDSVTAESVFQVFEHLVSQGKTVIMVTHDNSMVPRFSRHLTLTDGKIEPEPELIGEAE
jgi:putative ABC transport system ATP-binding protein